MGSSDPLKHTVRAPMEDAVHSPFGAGLEEVRRGLILGQSLEGLSSSTLEPLLRPQHREDQQRTGQPHQR